jgi:hypothetical protein
MKCLSIRQPWAWLVCVGAKQVENRSWNTTYRGVIAIHAGGNTKAVDQLIKLTSLDTPTASDLFAFGAIIGTAEIYDARPFDQAMSDQPWAEGPYCIFLRNTQLFVEPIPHKGRVNLCELPAHVNQLVENRMSHCHEVGNDPVIAKFIQAIPVGSISLDLLRPIFRPSRM